MSTNLCSTALVVALETRSASWLASLDFIGYPSHHPPQSLGSSGKVRFNGAKLVHVGAKQGFLTGQIFGTGHPKDQLKLIKNG